jgi:hypothetical protein
MRVYQLSGVLSLEVFKKEFAAGRGKNSEH